MKKTTKLLGGLLCTGLLACSSTQKPTAYAIIPQPNEMVATSGQLTLSSDMPFEIVNTDTTFTPIADQIKSLLEKKYNLTHKPEATYKVVIQKVSSDNNEAYTLQVTTDSIKIQAAAPNGAFYALQTLQQMLPCQQQYQKQNKATLQHVTIKDAPRFKYRGTHLDVSRHFVTPDSVKRFIDILAIHKINTFHWHLTDDQGWRLEIKKYPKLTEIGSKRKRTVIGRNSSNYDSIPHSGFYTQEQVKDIIAYAAKKYITIIPEIDLPGHMLGALSAYPTYGCVGKGYQVAEKWGVFEDVLCAGNPNTLPFLNDIFDEVIALFPSKYIHVGGDECPKDRWQSCPKCQKAIRHLGLTDDPHHTAEQKLQSHIMNSIEVYLNRHGRSLVGWDEILEGGISPNATLMAWRSSNYAFDAAKLGNDAILCPNRYYYLDYYQTEDIQHEPLAIGGCSTINQLYTYEPVEASVPAEIQAHILGVQANVWSEYMKTFKHVEYMLLPRLAAVAETGWTNPQNKDLNNFLYRLTKLTHTYDEAGYNYGKHIFDVRKELHRDTLTHQQTLVLHALDNSPIYYTTDGSAPTTLSIRYKQPIDIDTTLQIKACIIREGVPTRVLNQHFKFNKATLKPIKLHSKSYPDYTFTGATILNDGMKGEKNYRSGYWLGYNNEDLSTTIDLLQPTNIQSVGIRSLVSTADWVFRPTSISISTSTDGLHYTVVGEKTIPQATSSVFDIEQYDLSFTPTETRFVRVQVNSLRNIPHWHPAKGKPAFLFVDEIAIL